MRVAIGSDHGGFELKTQLAEYVRSLGCAVEDVGTKSVEPCDYPDFAYAVGMLVAGGRANLGIMIDGAGIGSCMVVNKIPGIRGACCTHEFMARNAREHNNANVLTLGSRVVGLEVAKAIVGVFLHTAFAGGRHEARVKKIMDVDQKYRRSL
ncbi:MAG: ribose 5-phosphate isomerase B [Bacteroidetes bacterium]|nr:ribose 5-phosphate isomerase B [Bacteroidota bacterium]